MATQGYHAHRVDVTTLMGCLVSHPVGRFLVRPTHSCPYAFKNGLLPLSLFVCHTKPLIRLCMKYVRMRTTTHQETHHTTQTNTLVYITHVEQPNDDDIEWLLTGETLETPASPSEMITIEVKDLPEDIDTVSWETDTWYFFGGLRELDSTDNYVADVLFEFDNRGMPLRDDWMYPSNRTNRHSRFFAGQTLTNSQPLHTQSQSKSTLSTQSPKYQSMNQNPSVDNIDTGTTASTHSLRSHTQPTAQSNISENTIGMATGGEKDSNNFRDNVQNHYIPEVEAFSHEGLFSEYYFERGNENATNTNTLFYPSYATAVSPHPITNDTETFITVGLNSNIPQDMFESPPLNLVAVIDISGSMKHPFDEYYYDGFGNKIHANKNQTDDAETKMEAAIEALKGVTKHLDERDRFGVVLFNSEANVAKPLREVSKTDMDAIREHINELEAGGSTNMSAGLEEAYNMLRPARDQPTIEQHDSIVENRVVFLTDEMPNTGQTNRGDLVNMIDDAASDEIYTSFIGVGLDTNTELGDELSNVTGANHYFIHTPEEFTQRLDEEFEYMVTPLVFDLRLELETENATIKNVYGAPSVKPDTGEVMNVATLFPSKTEKEQTKGGVILIELDRENVDTVELSASWRERDGTSSRVTETVELPSNETYDNTGIRKAIVLARYCNALQSWAKAVREHDNTIQQEYEREIPVFDGMVDQISEFVTGKWEHSSVSYTPVYNETLDTIRTYVDNHIGILNEPQLKNEVELLSKILGDNEQKNENAD